MSQDITVTFLGTTSGGGPTETRNCSSLVLDPLADGSLWMIDCAEGTLRQFSQQPYFDNSRRVKISKLTRIFITHMHADHTAGLITILRNVLGIPSPHARTNPSSYIPAERIGPPKLEIYGPRGLRRFVRIQCFLTHTHSASRYAVHELLAPGERPSVPSGAPNAEEGEEAEVEAALVPEGEGLLENEAPGRDIPCDKQGFWRAIVDEETMSGGRRSGGRIVVDAGPIEHRDPCIGYIVREVPNNAFSPDTPVPRKIVILGDTYDPSALIPLIDPPIDESAPSSNSTGTSSGVPIEIMDEDGDTPAAAAPTPVTLLIHEATDAYIPPTIDPQERTGRNRSFAIVEEKARERGHSTPWMAGAFARRIGAERLVLNHIGARFPAPAHPTRSPMDQFRLACMREIERQAQHAWQPRKPSFSSMHVQAAWDFMRVVIPPNAPPSAAKPPAAGQDTWGPYVPQEEEELMVSQTSTVIAGMQRAGHLGQGSYGGSGAQRGGGQGEHDRGDAGYAGGAYRASGSVSARAVYREERYERHGAAVRVEQVRFEAERGGRDGKGGRGYEGNGKRVRSGESDGSRGGGGREDRRGGRRGRGDGDGDRNRDRDAQTRGQGSRGRRGDGRGDHKRPRP